jgi:hypothetical protein
MSGLLQAAYEGDIARMKQLLAEGASITERDADGWGVLVYAARNAQYTAMQWLLLEGGASIGEVGLYFNETIWNELTFRSQNPCTVQLSALLKVMVMLEDAPMSFLARISRQDHELCDRGRQLRAQLPSYLEQQRGTIVRNCPLPAVLQFVVIAYAKITPEEMWADRLLIP